MADKNFQNRVAKARAAARFAQVVSRDKNGRSTVIRLPGSRGKNYRVIIRRSDSRQPGTSVECLLEVGVNGTLPCKGNGDYIRKDVYGERVESVGTCCYHSQAALVVAAEDAGYDLRLTNSPGKAEKLKNLGFAVSVVRPWLSRYSAVWACHRRKKS